MKSVNGFDGHSENDKRVLLAVDVGNTNITFGVFQDEVIEHQWRIESDRDKTSDEYGIELEQILLHFGYRRENIKDIIISSVVPDLLHQMGAMCKRYLKKDPIIVGAGTRTGINIKVDNPKELGTDRVVNSVAGFTLYGGPLIILDLGTAIKHDVVSPDGCFLGGAISPGIGISMDALFSNTSKLPKIDLTLPERAIGKNTVEAMRSGIVYGFLGLINNLSEKISDEMEVLYGQRPKVVATGGFLSMLSASALRVDIIDRDLTLIGLRLVYERTMQDREKH